MKKVFTLTILCLLFMLGTSFAQGPYLVCDPYPTGPEAAVPNEFVIVLNGFEYISAAATDPVTGGVYLNFDLDTLWSPGPNSLIVWARNIWGESTQVPFAFFAGPPLAPQGTRIVGSSQ
jgi:hypothetical protein